MIYYLKFLLKKMENKIDFTQENFDYLMMFIHLTGIEDEFEINGLINGVCELTNIKENKKGYIYKKTNKELFLVYDDKNIFFGTLN